MPENRGKESAVLEIVRSRWPISALEIAENLSERISSREDKKRQSTNYSYYLKKLIAKRLVLSKRVGNALIVWPIEVEAYRTIHEILKESGTGRQAGEDVLGNAGQGRQRQATQKELALARKV